MTNFVLLILGTLALGLIFGAVLVLIPGGKSDLSPGALFREND